MRRHNIYIVPKYMESQRRIDIMYFPCLQTTTWPADVRILILRT